MRNFKKVIALVLAVALMMSTMTVAFAAETTSAGTTLKTLGLINDDSATGLSTVLSRAIGLKMVLTTLGYTQADADAAVASPFTDTTGWVTPWANLAYAKGITKGYTATTFGGSVTMTGDQFLTLVLRGLGQTVPSTKDAVGLALAAGLLPAGTIALPASFTKAGAATIMLAALNVTVAGVTVLDSLIAKGIVTNANAIAVGLKSADLTVVSVTALSATVVAVKFSTAVDATDGIAVGNYKIGANSPATVVLSADQMTATLTFAAATSVEVTNAAVVVLPIVSKDNDIVKTKTYVGLLTFEDKTNPAVSKVESSTNLTVASSVTVTFTEPINSVGTVKIDGVVKTPTGFAAGNTTAVFNGLSLSAAASHTIQFIGLTDQGANVLANDTQTFSITTDKVAPTATLSASGDHTIIVTFDKAMTSSTVLAALTAANNRVKDAALVDVAYSNATAVANSDNKKFQIVVTAAIYASATSKTLTVVLPSTMTDSLGNAFVGTTAQITLTKDVTAPAITKVVPKLNAAGEVTGFVVTVSEGVANAAITPSNTNIVIVDSNGVLVPTTGAGALLGGLNAVTPAAGDTSFIIDIATDAKKTGVLYFSFASGLFQDTALTANNSVAANFTVDFGAATAVNTFTLAGASVTIAANVITVVYANAVKGGGVAGSATDLNNYTLNGSVVPTGTTITLNAAQTTATITLPAGAIATNDTGAVFTINNVTQLTGETIVAFTKALSVTDNTKPVMNYAVLNADNTITVGFSETVTGIVAADLIVKVNGTVVTGTIAPVAGTGLNAGKWVLDLDTEVLNDTTQTYVDFNASNAYNAGDLILATEGARTTKTLSSAIAVTGVTIETKATALTGADASANVITSGTSITVK